MTPSGKTRAFESDKFLSLPKDTQVIWFHLRSRADEKSFMLFTKQL